MYRAVHSKIKEVRGGKKSNLPKTRGSAVVRTPHFPMAHGLIVGGKAIPHCTISSEDDVGASVGACVGGEEGGVGGSIAPHEPLVLT